MEDRALNSIENVLNALDHLLENGVSHVIVVTSDFHMDRIKAIFKELLPKRYSIEFVEDHPNLSLAMKLEEERTEIRMLSQLKNHLKNYTFS